MRAAKRGRARIRFGGPTLEAIGPPPDCGAGPRPERATAASRTSPPHCRRPRKRSEAACARRGAALEDGCTLTRRAALAALYGAGRIPGLAQGDPEARFNATNQILLPVRVNGKGPVWCLLDTGGARFLYLSPEKAAALGIAASSTVPTGGPMEAGYRDTGTARVTLDVAGLHLEGQEVLIKKTSGDGLIGTALFAPSIVEIDFRTPGVRFHAPASFRYRGAGATVGFEISSFNPRVEASLDLDGGAPVLARMTVDTGAPWGAAYLTPKFDAAMRAQGRSLPWVRERTGFSTCRISGLSVGRFSMAHPVIHLLPTQGFGNGAGAPDGVVGVDFLQRYRIFLDYTKKQMILEPNAGAPPVQKVDPAELIKGGDLVQDNFTPIAFRLPPGWKLVSAERWGDHETTLGLEHAGAPVRLYYQFPLNPSTAPPDLGKNIVALPAKNTKSYLAAGSADALRNAQQLTSTLSLP